MFLDYDGTLTPIVSDPDAATLSDHMRDAVGKLSDKATVAIVSGRAREKLRNFVQLPELYYAGSHGFDIDGPGGTGRRPLFLCCRASRRRRASTATAPARRQGRGSERIFGRARLTPSPPSRRAAARRPPPLRFQRDGPCIESS